ncbi:MAG TPA: hypothetical protein VF518_10595, partial [Polyangia bacterium]
GPAGHGILLMRIAALALTLLTALAGACAFKAHPISGQQSCSDDDPPQCPDGYACVAGLCYVNNDLRPTEDAGNDSGDSGTESDAACKPVTIVCGQGSGKRCGKVSNQCSGTVECGACIAGESCGTNHLCSVLCGQAGQPCCTGSTCTAVNTVCSNGICAACGGANQYCCTTGDACSALGSMCSETTSTTSGTACLLACAATTGACVTGTDLDCYVQCGPGKIGSKTCTCASDAWKCPACAFPTGADYSCYKLPTTVPLCDATTTPTAGASCTAANCSPCGSAAGKGYIDATGVSRSGYCICTSNRWNCALTREWPCPGNTGC